MKIKALVLKSGAVAAIALAADQSSKWYIRSALEPSLNPPLFADRISLVGPLGLVRVENAGSSFGFFQGLWVWVLLAIAGILLIPLYARKLTGAGRLAALAAGLQTGGALGNLADRIIYGGVTDFIDLGWGPIFNLADVFILIGMALAVWTLARAEWRRERRDVLL